MAIARPIDADRGRNTLAERDAALAALRRYLDEDARAGGGVVLIRGEAGIAPDAASPP